MSASAEPDAATGLSPGCHGTRRVSMADAVHNEEAMMLDNKKDPWGF